jgi:hypothetical protein
LFNDSVLIMCLPCSCVVLILTLQIDKPCGNLSE